MIDFDFIRKDERFLEWSKYAPGDFQYVKYAEKNPSLIAAGYKITDVYFAFVNARASFMFSDSKSFGDLSTDDPVTVLFTRIHLLTNAIIEYAITLDLSWQVLWAYIFPSSLEKLVNLNTTEMEKYCDRDSLLAQIECAISQHGYGCTQAIRLKEMMKEFDNDEDILKLREIYNRIKHRGAINIENLWPNKKVLLSPSSRRNISILNRPDYSKEQIEEILFSYHNKFTTYFNKIIAEIMPADYTNNRMDGLRFFDSLNRLLDLTN